MSDIFQFFKELCTELPQFSCFHGNLTVPLPGALKKEKEVAFATSSRLSKFPLQLTNQLSGRRIIVLVINY